MDEQQLTPAAVEAAVTDLGAGWEVVAGKLRREYACADFMAVIRLVNRIADLAEAADHHPDLHIYYTRLVVELWTHKFKGLSDKDFALAKEIEAAFAAAAF